MRICCIIHSLGVGGMEKVMSILIQNFSLNNNLEIHLLLIGNKRNVAFELPKNVIIHKPKWPFDNSKRFYHTIKTLFFIRKTVKAIQPNSILSFGELWNNLVLLALYGTHFKVFVSDRSRPNKDLGKLHNWLRNFFYPSAAGFIAQTQKAFSIAKTLKWNTNITIIGNPIKQVHFSANLDSNIILNVGRLVKTKNIDSLIRIFNTINIENKNNWDLVIVGGDAQNQNLFEQLKKQVVELNLENNVKMVGEQKALDNFYKNASIFAFTSSSEGFPNALGEAMAAGLAVVAYDCVAGPSDLIDDGINGFLVEEGNEELFRQRIITLMLNNKLRINFGQNAKIKIQQFEDSIISKRFLEFIN